MDLKCLSYFVAVVETGSFAAASARLHIAQPALGWQIRKLEEELGVKLMTRHSRGVEPTEAGLRLLEHARAILARTQAAVGELRSFSRAPRGTVVLGMTPSTNALLTLPLLERLSAQATQIRIRPVEELSAVLSEWVGSGRLDLAIGMPIIEMHGLSWEPLLQEAHYFVEKARPGVASGGTIPFAAAARHELVMTVMSQSYTNFLRQTAKAHAAAINIVHQMQSVATLRDLLLRGVGASILPLGVVTREVAAGTLTARRIVEPEINREVVLMRPKGRPITKAEQFVCDVIRRLVAETAQQSPGFWTPARTLVHPAAGAVELSPDAGSDPGRAVPGRRSGRLASFDDLLRV